MRDIAPVLQLTVQDIQQDLPLQLSPENDLLIPLGDRVEITQVVPDLQAMATLGRREVLRGFCLFTTRTRDPTVQVHSRFFVPHYGVPEDPATGSVHGPLAVYLWRYGLVRPRGSIVALVGKQGDEPRRKIRMLCLTAYRADAQKRPLRSRFRQQLTPGVRHLKEQGYDHRQHPIGERNGP